MKIYEIKYQLQNNLDIKSSLKKECDYSHTDENNHIFIKEDNKMGRKIYIVPNDGKEFTEYYIAKLRYVFCTITILLISSYLFLINFNLSISDWILILCAFPMANLLSIYPHIITDDQPKEFHPKKQQYSLLARLRPLPFQKQVDFSPIVYLNNIFAAIITVPLVFPEMNILAVVFPTSVLALFLMFQDQSDPATNNVVALTALILLPFALPIINLGIYTQLPTISQQNTTVLTALTPDPFHPVVAAITSVMSSSILNLLLVNLISILFLLFIYKLPYENQDRIEVYKMPTRINDKKHLRIGISLLFFVYVGGSISLLISQLVGHPLVPVETMFAKVLVYWPLVVVIISWVAVWYLRQQKNSTEDEICTTETAFFVEGYQVVFAETGGAAAFPMLSEDGPKIVLNNQLQEDLTDDEIKAICYHEIYHIEHDSIKYQDRVEIPIVGHLLFFLTTNFSELYNEEYYADEFAAKKVGPEVVISGLEKKRSMNFSGDEFTIRSHFKGGWQGYAHILYSMPVLALYSPPDKYRISQLESLTENRELQSDV